MTRETTMSEYNKIIVQSLYTCIKKIPSKPHKFREFKNLLKKIPEKDRFDVLHKEAKKRVGATVLHRAIIRYSFETEVERRLVKYLVKHFPKLILHDRRETEYAGQTPLHMAVCKGNQEIVEMLLQKVNDNNDRKALFRTKAIGSIFQNTVMMGELPLIIAALTFNKGIFDLLLDNGAKLDAVNRYGECVSHCLIRYAFLYNEKQDDVLDMCAYISKVQSEDPSKDPSKDHALNGSNNRRATNTRKLRKKIWVMNNEEGLNPLQLAANLGQHELFDFIMNLEAYCIANEKDGLFDIKIYDVTEIDAIASMKTEDITGSDENSQNTNTKPENVADKKATVSQLKPYNTSILMTMFELDPMCAFHFLQFPAMRRTIDQKWDAYCVAFYFWFLLHFMFTCFLTWYGVERAQQNANNDIGTEFDVNRKPNFKSEITKDPFVTAFGAITLFVSAFYFIQEIVRTVKGKMPWTLNSFLNPYSNGWFRVTFVLLGLSFIIDFIFAIVSEYYENYCLIVAVINCWLIIIFFLRVIRAFSFFTILIQRVLFGDMLRFFVILGILLIAFSTAMYMVIQGSNVIETTEFSDFQRVMFSMFKLMVGLGEVAELNDTRHPALAITIFIGFIIMTTLLMLNALIAIMSRTCTELVENVGNVSARDRHWKLQRLSAILFIESILPQSMITKVGKEKKLRRYNNKIKRRKKMMRYMLEVRSLQKGTDNIITMSRWGLITDIVNTFKNKQVNHGDQERPTEGNDIDKDKGKDNHDNPPAKCPHTLEITTIKRCGNCSNKVT